MPRESGAGSGGKREGARLVDRFRARRARRRSPDPDRLKILDELYFEGEERRPGLVRFAVLMTLSVLIATYGIATDSGPVVIGAMLVAPLMTPLLGLSAALVLGWSHRQAASAVIVVLAGAGGVALAWLAAAIIPQPQGILAQSEELLARTAPSSLDMSIALAAGAAGAYVNVHRKAVAALPGAAIAVALIPPLSALGIALQLDRGDLASGALLLYLTNLAGIVLGASATFIATGYVARREQGRFDSRTRRGLIAAVVAVLVVSYPIGRLGQDAINRSLDSGDVGNATRDWIGDRDLEVDEATVDDDEVDVRISGSVDPPPVGSLAAAIRDRLGRPVELTLRYTPERVERVTAAGP